MLKRVSILLLCVLFCAIAVSCDLDFKRDQNISLEVDHTFGENGVVMTNFLEFGGDMAYGWTIALQPDGKIVMSGDIYYEPGPQEIKPANCDEHTFIGVTRYNQDGSLDKTFGDDGKVGTYLEGRCHCMVRQIAFDSAGNIIVVANLDTVYSDPPFEYADPSITFALIRYLPNGELDETFGDDGIVMVRQSGNYRAASHLLHGLAVDDAGNIILLFSISTDLNQEYPIMHMVRYDRNGDIDTTFGENGRVVTSLGSWWLWLIAVNRPIAIDNSGKILIVGRCSADEITDSDTAMERYNPDGSLDLTFGENGRATSGTSQPYRGQNIKLLDEGKFLVMGSTLLEYGNFEDLYAARYNYDGSVDIIFDHSETVSTETADIDIYGNKLASQVFYLPDGRIIISGYTNVGFGFGAFTTNLFLACFNQDGVLDTSIGNKGILKGAFWKDISFPQDTNIQFISDIVIQTDGSIFAAGMMNSTDSDSLAKEFAIVRYVLE